jgi:hypothetical protein
MGASNTNCKDDVPGATSRHGKKHGNIAGYGNI